MMKVIIFLLAVHSGICIPAEILADLSKFTYIWVLS